MTDLPELSLLKAGCLDESYSERVNGFDWRGLFERAPALIPAFAEWLAERYDYILIDSRTGITDIGGICTMLMPQKLVAVFTPNRQSLQGVSRVVQDAFHYRKASDDLRPLTIFPLPSRVDESERELRASWRLGDPGSDVYGYQPLFERLFRELYHFEGCDLDGYFDEVQIQHVPFYSYGEVVAVLVEEEADRLSLSQSFKRFTDILTSFDAPWQHRR